MSTKNVKQESEKVELNAKKFDLKYSLASFAYLSEKYGDLGELFSSISVGGKNKFSKDFIKTICELVYAGVMRCDADALDAGKSFVEADTSGWSTAKIMTEVGMNDIDILSEAIQKAMAGAMPETDPTKAAKAAR